MKKTLIALLTAALASAGLWADDSFFSGSDDSSPAVEIGGSVTASVRAYLSKDALKAIGNLDNSSDAVDVSTDADLTIDYSGKAFAVHSDFTFSPDAALSGDYSTSDAALVKVNEAYGQYFGSHMSLEAGMMKVVWGKADEYHVVDVLNNMNLSQFLLPDYLDMIDPETMVKLNIPIGMSSNLEVAYVPVLTPNVYDEQGIWTPAEIKTDLPSKLAYFASLGLTPVHVSDADTNTMDYGQGALHFTSSVAGLDFGFTYYAGYNKTPTFNYEQSGTDINYWFSYDPMHIFGAEASYVLAGFNLKGEFAYNMTYDFAGDDATVHNNSISWIGGFDRDIPLGNLNINIQETGSYILNNDKITATDIEYNSDGIYSRNMLIVALTDKFLHEKLEAKLIGFYHFEKSDFGVYPSVDFSPADDFTLTLKGRFFGGDSGTFFGQYKDNGYMEMSLSWNY